MWNHGLVLGKFYPFHKGHAHLIRTAKTQCEQVTVLLCSMPTESIPGTERYRAMTQELANDTNIRVVLIDKIMPQYPHEDEQFWDKWVGLVKERSMTFDVIFTSEIYGDAFSRHLGIDHVQLPIDRRDVPTSGTAVRKSPTHEWNNLPTSSKEYFVKTICLVGTESVGKTTLAAKLAEHFNTIWVPEYGRTFVDTVANGKFYPDDFLLIALMQNRLIINGKEKVAEQGGQYLFVDTDASVTVAFTHMYETYRGIERIPDHEKVYDMLRKEPIDLYLFLENDVPWVRDHQREFGDDVRDVHAATLRRLIPEEKCVSISGTFEERFQKAIEAITR